MRIVLGVEYDGSQYRGWQKQQTVPSIQMALESALAFVANEPITLFCAGRTDAGVHATGQVVHFETTVSRPDVAWIMGVNARLPPNIAVHWVKRTAHDFHARFSALARCYRYVVYNNKCRTAVFHNRLAHYHLPLDEKRMAGAAECLLGEHDFSAFRSAQCQSKTPWRHVYYLRVVRLHRYVIFDIKANAFVHNMVRNIVGSLLLVGSGQKPEGWISELLANRDRTQAGPTAKATGLYLVSVDYPAKYNLPKSTLGPLFVDLAMNTN